MQKFLFLVSKLVIIFIFFNIALYLWVGNAESSRFYNYYETVKKINKKHYKYLVTGDSHANDCWFHNNDPEVLDFSFPGDNQLDIKRKVSFLKKNNITYDTHLYEMDAQVLSTYRETTNNNDLSLLYDNHLRWIKTRTIFPLVFNPRMWTDIKNKVIKPKEDKNDIKVVIDTFKMEARAKTQFLEKEFSKRMFLQMKENIEVDLNQKTNVIFLHYPFYEGYLNIIETNGTYLQSIDSSKQLAKELNLILLDFSRLICKPTNFSNQDHLNLTGAKTFTNYLSNCLSFKNCKPDFCIDK